MKREKFDHYVWGPSLYETRSRICAMVDPIVKSFGKNSEQMKKLLAAIDHVDRLRTILENHLAGEVTQAEWDEKIVFNVYRPGSSKSK